MMVHIVVSLVLAISFVTDIKQRKILNIVTFPSIIFGFAYHSIVQGWNGFLFSSTGFLLGASVLLIPYILGGMGAGDVKLMAAIGALTGTDFVFQSFLYSAVIGGIIAVSLIIHKSGLRGIIQLFFFYAPVKQRNMGQLSGIAFPYGVAIVLGAICSYVGSITA